MPRLSVIIPTYNEEEHIREVCQRASHQHGLDSVQVFVVDGGSTDRTREIAKEYAPVFRTSPGRARQMNEGLGRAEGTVVLFCHGDTLLPENYGQAVMNAFQDPRVVGGAFRPQYRPAHPMLSLAELVFRMPTSFVMFGDQALFARRSSLKDLGGVPSLAIMEDVALVQALRGEGKLVRLKEQVITSSRRFQEQGVLQQLMLVLRLLFQYHVLNVSPEQLEERYHVTGRDVKAGGKGAVLGVFAKAPIPGHAKTRLGEEVGMERAAAVYESILRSFLSHLMKRTAAFQKVLFVAGRQDQRWFKDQFPAWRIQGQKGRNLGERMANAFQDLFAAGVDRVVIAGSDIPDLTEEIINEAFLALHEVDVVLGPGEDGGYYLIGLRQPEARLFERIPWGTSRVLEITKSRAEDLGLKVKLLQPLRDIDTGEDWEMYQDRMN